jgi:TP901 family phage tail tape measure protein
MNVAPIKIQLAIEGAAVIGAQLDRVLSDARKAFSGISEAGKSIAGGMATADKAIAELTARIDRSNASFQRLRESGKLTAEQLERLDAIRQRQLINPISQQRSQLQAQQADLRVAGARDTLGVRPFADIKSDIDQAKKAFDTLKASGTLSATEIAQAQLKLRERIAELRAQTNGFAQSFVAVKESLAAAAASFLVFRAASQEAIAFEAAMADVRKVVDATPEGFAQITQSIRGLASELPITAVGLAQMAEAGGQLGIAGDKIPEFVRLAAEMSVAFKISAEEAGNAVGKLGNVFGLQVPQVRNLADSVNALGDSTAATERDIVNVLQRSGGMARQFGLSAEQTAALATSILSLGDAPEVAATGINNLLSKLQSAPQQSKEFLAVLKVLGVDAKQLAVDIEQDAQGALLQFLGTLEKLDNKSRSQALTGLFGTGGDTASLAKLTGNLDQLRTALKTAQGEAAQGGLGRALAIQTETADSALKVLRNNVGDIGIALGAVFLPVIKALAAMTGALAQFIAKVVDAAPVLTALAAAAAATLVSLGALKIAFSTLGLLGAKLGALLPGMGTGLAALLPAGGAAATGITLIGTAMKAALGPIGLVVAGVTALMLALDAMDRSKAKALAGASTTDLEAQRARLQKEQAALAALPLEQGVPQDTTTRDQLAAVEGELERRRRANEEALRAGAGARGGAGKGFEGKTDLTAKLQAETEAARAAADKARAAADANASLTLAEFKALTDAELRLIDERETALEAARAAGQTGEREAADKSLAIEQDRLTVKARLVQKEIDLEALRATAPGDAAAAAQQQAKLVALRAQLADVTAQIAQAPGKAAARRNFASDDPTFDPLGDADRKFTDAGNAKADARFQAAQQANQQFQGARQQLSLALIRDDRQRAQAELDIEAQRLRDALDLQVLSDADRRQREDELTAYLADKNAQLADQYKPGWQKLVEGWADTTKLMRDHTDTLMSTFVQAGEDAFVKFAQTGKLQFKGLVDTLIAEMARVQYRELLGNASKVGDGNILDGLVKLGAEYFGGARADVAAINAGAATFDFASSIRGPGFSDGGPVRGPGTGTSDDIPAMLSNGEFVVRAAAVQKLGVGLLQRLNRADRVPAFAAGGLVGKMPALAASAQGAGAGASFTYRGGPIQIDARSDQGQIAQLVAGAQAQERRAFMAELKARGVLR